MAEKTFDAAIGFLPQVAYGDYTDALNDDVTTSWALADGLVLGDPNSGIGESGLSISLARISRDRPDFAGSYTKQISSYLRTEVGSFSFSFPFAGNRADASGGPDDTDFPPIAGIDALLVGAGLVGSGSGTPGHDYDPRAVSAILPISALIFVSGNRLQLQDCFVTSLAIDFTPGTVPIATATIEVGSVQLWSADDVPATLTYGEQATVSAATVLSVAHTFDQLRSFTAETLTISMETERIPDSETVTGDRVRPIGRSVTVSGTHRVDTVAGDDFDRTQIIADDLASISSMTFQVGAAATGTDPALAHKWTIGKPEMLSTSPDRSGNVAVTNVELLAKGTAADDEIQLEFL